MPLLPNLPASLVEPLRVALAPAHGADLATLTPDMVFETDVAFHGQWGQEWVVVADGRVLALREVGGGVAIIHSVPVEDLREARAEILVGNGVLQVKTPRETVTLMRYSHAAAAEATAIARQFNRLAKGEQPKWDEVENKRRYCPKASACCLTTRMSAPAA
jgi:hypothetical protein